MDNSTKRSDGQVVIKLDARLFYLVVIVLGLVAAFAVGVFVARQFGGSSGTAFRPATQSQVQANPPGNPAANPIQVQPGQAGQLNLGQPGQPGQVIPGQPGQTIPGQPGQPAQIAKAPATKDVPIGDNPRLSLPELEGKNFIWDFGSVSPDQKVEKTFEVVNPGTKELLIEDVSSSCGCTAALVSDSKVAPGGKAQLRVTYDPRVNKDKGTYITRKVRVKSNDPAAPLAEFSISANVANE